MNNRSTLRSMRPVLIFALIGVIFMFAAPYVLQLFTIINLTTAIALAVLALSLALVWGYGGILCFGQVAFFNSLALGMLASIPKKARRYDRVVSFCNFHPQAMWSVQATRLHELLDIYFDEEQALAAM